MASNTDMSFGWNVNVVCISHKTQNIVEIAATFLIRFISWFSFAWSTLDSLFGKMIQQKNDTK